MVGWPLTRGKEDTARERTEEDVRGGGRARAVG